MAKLEWKGAQFRGQVVDAIAAGLTEFGIRHESEAKRQLVPGQGVLTGTLRRSIHAAGPSYNFAADDVAPAPGTPERAGTGGEAEEIGGSVVISVGSGMSYARKIEELYYYLTDSFWIVEPQLLPTLEKHARERGLL